MSASFDDLLQRVNKLNTTVRLGHISEFPKNFAGVKINPDVPTSIGYELGDLNDIFKASEEIWQRKQLGTADWTKPLRKSALKQLIEAEKPPQPSKAKQQQRLVGPVSGYDDASLKEINRYIGNAIQRSRLDAERAFLNQRIIDTTPRRNPYAKKSLSLLQQPLGRLARGFDATQAAMSAKVVAEPLAFEQNTFASKIDNALNKNCRAPIKDALKEAVLAINDKEVTHLWDQIHVLCNNVVLPSEESIVEFRSSRPWAFYVIKEATAFLQEQFRNHMESEIAKNLAIAKRGGVPGTLPLVEAFLNVNPPTVRSRPQDGLYGKHPAWCVLFHCLRLGDFSAAETVAKKQLANIPSCSALVGAIINVANGTPVEGDPRNKLIAEWRHESSGCRDLYKKGTYGLFLGFECNEVNETIENWVWARLTACQLHPERLHELFLHLQSDVSVKHGEEYFLKQSGGDYSVYFTALWLTGQLEAAIDVLFRADRQVHAVHAAIYAYQQRLLILTERISSQLLTASLGDPTQCQLNYGKMVLIYVKNFELTNVNFALNYCYYLRNLEFDRDNDEKTNNIFEACVSRIVYLSRETDQILGRLTESGQRLPGLIDKFDPAITPSDVVARVAFDTYISGDMLEACRLYVLAQHPNDAIRLMCKHLSLCIPQVDETSETAIRMAQWMANRYKQSADPAIGRSDLSTMFLLIDLFTFFKLVKNDDKESAMRVMQRLQFLPLEQRDVHSYVASFHMIADEVRAVLPEICLAMMRLVVVIYQDKRSSAITRQQMQAMATAVVQFSAMIPYRFPLHINSQILQLQARVC